MERTRVHNQILKPNRCYTHNLKSNSGCVQESNAWVRSWHTFFRQWHEGSCTNTSAKQFLGSIPVFETSKNNEEFQMFQFSGKPQCNKTPVDDLRPTKIRVSPKKKKRHVKGFQSKYPVIISVMPAIHKLNFFFFFLITCINWTYYQIFKLKKNGTERE